MIKHLGQWFQKQYTNMGINWEGNMRMFIFTGSCLLSFICEGIASILTKLFTHNDSSSLLSSAYSPWRFPSVSLQEPRSLGEVPGTAPRPWPRNFPSRPNRLSFQPPYALSWWGEVSILSASVSAAPICVSAVSWGGPLHPGESPV